MSVPVTAHSEKPVLVGETDDGRRVRVAIVISCYNLGAYLREAYDSACEQTLPGVEIVIVDDGSTDPETQRVLAELASEQARVLHLENGGVARACNIGIRSTSGRSPNVVRGLEAARSKGATVIALTGQGGGTLRSVADLTHSEVMQALCNGSLPAIVASYASALSDSALVRGSR